MSRGGSVLRERRQRATRIVVPFPVFRVCALMCNSFICEQRLRGSATRLAMLQVVQVSQGCVQKNVLTYAKLISRTGHKERSNCYYAAHSATAGRN